MFCLFKSILKCIFYCFLLLFFDRLLSFHGQPFAWFIAQFLKLLMQPSDELDTYIKEKKKVLGLTQDSGPLVG